MMQPRVHLVAASSTPGCSLSHIRLQPPSHTVAGEISHLAEPLTPQKLSFNPMPEPPLNPWRSPPGTPPRDDPHAPHVAAHGLHGVGAAEPPPPPLQSIDEKLQVLRRRCEHELGSDGFELLHSLCLANGGQLTRPLDLKACDNVT